MKLLKHVPNILTIVNLFMGIGVALILMQPNHPHKIIIASLLIFVGAMADFFDGILARKLNAVSDLGKQLDSFADIITFGIAPVLVVNYVSTPATPFLLILASLIFVLAGAYRLARFNMADFTNYFLGLPIPAAGLSLAVYCLLHPLWQVVLPMEIAQAISAIFTPIFMLVLSAMMVSNKKIKRLGAEK